MKRLRSLSVAIALLVSFSDDTSAIRAAQDLAAGDLIPGEGYSYLVTTAQPVRERPSNTAKILSTVTPLRVLRAIRTYGPFENTWLLVQSVPWKNGQMFLDEAKALGWVSASQKNIRARTFEESMTLFDLMETATPGRPWPTATKIAVWRGDEPQLGFTTLQVRLCLGKPNLTTSEETKQGTTETYFYQGTFGYTFRNDRAG